MRLICIPTDKNAKTREFPHAKITIEFPGDDFDIYEMAEMFRSIALARGYSKEDVDEILPT